MSSSDSARYPYLRAMQKISKSRGMTRVRSRVAETSGPPDMTRPKMLTSRQPSRSTSRRWRAFATLRKQAALIGVRIHHLRRLDLATWRKLQNDDTPTVANQVLRRRHSCSWCSAIIPASFRFPIFLPKFARKGVPDPGKAFPSREGVPSRGACFPSG